MSDNIVEIMLHLEENFVATNLFMEVVIQEQRIRKKEENCVSGLMILRRAKEADLTCEVLPNGSYAGSKEGRRVV